MSLKQKTVSGLTWSFIDHFGRMGITFVVGIVLARLLSPKEFGLIGMTTIFIAISQSFVNSGFSQALIRKKDCTQADYSTVFFYNLTVGLLFYLIIFFASGAISRFFDEPLLMNVIRVLSLGLIIEAFTIIQRTRLTKRIDFKLLTKISFIASIFAGVIGVFLAYRGFGVWALVIKSLLATLITTSLLWLWNKWKPSFIFSIKSFKELFAFGSRLLIVGLIDTAYKNIYLIVIGKFYSAADLGFYTRAKMFKDLPSSSITSMVQRVSYPVLSSIQDDIPRLKASYQKLIKSTMLITMFSMMILAAVAKPLILTLIGEQWLQSVIYLQLMCFAGMLYPLHAINLNMLNVQGRSDIFLNLEIIKKIMVIPVIVIGVLYGIEYMIISGFFFSVIAFFLNSYYSGRHIGYSSFDQINDILPSLVLALCVGGVVFIVGFLLPTSELLKLIIQLSLAGVMAFGLMELLKLESYVFLKEIVVEKLTSIKNG